MKLHVRIATHRSPLAMMYTKKIVADIQQVHPHLGVDIVEVDTKGDQYFFERPPEQGSKCLYAEEVDRAILDGRAEIAVHVIEERARASLRGNWPRGWICAISKSHGDDCFYCITDLRKIPELLTPT